VEVNYYKPVVQTPGAMDTNREHGTGHSRHDEHRDASMFGMMAMMVAMCAGVLLLVFVVLPAVGYPLGLFVVFPAVALMFFLHARFMSHGRGH